MQIKTSLRVRKRELARWVIMLVFAEAVFTVTTILCYIAGDRASRASVGASARAAPVHRCVSPYQSSVWLLARALPPLFFPCVTDGHVRDPDPPAAVCRPVRRVLRRVNRRARACATNRRSVLSNRCVHVRPRVRRDRRERHHAAVQSGAGCAKLKLHVTPRSHPLHMIVALRCSSGGRLFVR